MFSDPSTMGRELDSSGSFQGQSSKRVEPTVWQYVACPRRVAASPWHASLRITSARRSIPSDPEYHECRPDAILTELWYAPTPARGYCRPWVVDASTKAQTEDHDNFLVTTNRRIDAEEPAPKQCLGAGSSKRVLLHK